MKKVKNTTMVIMAASILFFLVQVTPVLSQQTFSNSKMLLAKQKTPQKAISPHEMKKVEVCLSTAAITNCQIVGASGGTVGLAQLQLSWNYASSGVKPHKLQITVYRLQGTPPGSWDNIMPSSQPFEVTSPATTTTANVLIFRLFSGDYRIVFTAYYSCNRKRTYTFQRHI